MEVIHSSWENQQIKSSESALGVLINNTNAPQRHKGHLFLYQEVPETQRQGSVPERNVEFPQHRHHTKAAVHDFIPLRVEVRGLFRESDPRQRVLLGCWRVGNWRSLNKSHSGRLLILMTHPDHAARHTSLTSHPLLPFPLRCGNTLLLFLPFCPPRWTHPKPLLYEQNKLS